MEKIVGQISKRRDFPRNGFCVYSFIYLFFFFGFFLHIVAATLVFSAFLWCEWCRACYRESNMFFSNKLGLGWCWCCLCFSSFDSVCDIIIFVVLVRDILSTQFYLYKRTRTCTKSLVLRIDEWWIRFLSRSWSSSSGDGGNGNIYACDVHLCNRKSSTCSAHNN